MMTHQAQKIEASKLVDIDTRIEAARRQTWTAVERIAAAVHPGMRESEAIKLAQQTLVAMGVKKFWHKCHVRFGRDTVRSFEDAYSDQCLGEDDLFFIDIGPVWDDIEGDAGATYQVGSDSDKARCAKDARRVFDMVREHWLSTGASGQELYAYAGQVAGELGWVLAPSYVRGHRLSEFPHSFHTKALLSSLEFAPAPKRRVLEIHICDPDMRYGAFFEDLL